MSKIKQVIRKKLEDYQSGSYQSLEAAIDRSEVVSFDIFDTLLKRDVTTPTELFDVVGAKINDPHFKRKRVNAEIAARAHSNKAEITLDEIYNQLQDVSDKDSAKKIEIGCEIELSCPNKEMIPLYKKCLKSKRVVLTSDMYLPREVIEKLLEKNGVSGYEKLYISNEVNCTKADGKLFEYVLQDLQVSPDKVLHIGNSFKADYLKPREKRIISIKCATHKNRLMREYPDALQADHLKMDALNSFLNNHAPCSEDDYYNFGYEVFGPLLYGFVNWLYEDAKSQEIKKILFLSRDGYIMKRLYDALELDIPAEYFEVSRRSLRVPNYNENMSYAEMVGTLSVPNMTNVVQILDSFGLEADDYRDAITACGFTFDQQIKRDKLIENEDFHKLYDQIKADIFNEADKERTPFKKYIGQVDFSEKTAIVDIGWGGSMQKYMVQTLEKMGLAHNIYGYYVGLTLKAKENLGSKHLHAKGYAFDCLNCDDQELESSYIGLIETMFLEQKGSVKNYSIKDNHAVANRYPYEYFDGEKIMREALAVGRIQEGALSFSKDFHKTLVSKLIENDRRVMYSHMHTIGTIPTLADIRLFGTFRFFNCGDQVYLANSRSLLYYLSHPKALKRDIFDSQWKIGFLKDLCKLPLSYDRIFAILRKKAN